MPDLKGRYIVDTDWLGTHLGAPDLVVLDASWYLPTEKRDPKADYDREHIPGAIRFDIEDTSDDTSPLPHMLPSSVKFASCVKRMGIGDGCRVVVYDASNQGLFSAARVWWMFRAFGHENVAVLDGGLKKWKAEGREVTDAVVQPGSVRHFTPRANARLRRDLSDMKELVASRATQIVDARGAGRFAGREPEPRPGLRCGHIPGSCNLPSAQLIAADGTLKPVEELRQAFERSGVDLAKPVVTTCGSGVSAAILALALARCGVAECGLYDGSWSEWGQDGLDTEVGTLP